MTRFSAQVTGIFFVLLVLLPQFCGAWDLSREGWNELPGPRDEHVILGWTQVGSKPWLAIRAWTQKGRPRLLAVDPATLQTRIVDAPVPPSVSWAQAEERASPRSLYFRLRDAVLKTRSQEVNAGMGVWEPRRRGAWLSMDLCPSRKPLDRWVFTPLTRGRNTPLPVFLDVSGLWMSVHAKDLAWLIHEQSEGRLAITWVGHGELHPFDPNSPWGQTFDLTPGLDFHREVLGPERRLIALGQTPSVWYRFPGLISSPHLVKKLLDWGLLPLASGAWLNKNQKVHPGDVVLVHANGNEERGLRLLVELNKEKKALPAGEWSWLSLADFSSLP